MELMLKDKTYFNYTMSWSGNPIKARVFVASFVFLVFFVFRVIMILYIRGVSSSGRALIQHTPVSKLHNLTKINWGVSSSGRAQLWHS